MDEQKKKRWQSQSEIGTNNDEKRPKGRPLGSKTKNKTKKGKKRGRQKGSPNKLPTAPNEKSAYIPAIAEKLPDKWRMFAEEYIIDFNKTRAAKDAGYSVTTASTQGGKLYDNPKVKAYIDYLIDQRSTRTEITADRVVKELARVAYQDKRTFYFVDNTAVPLSRLTDEQQAAVKDIVFYNCSYVDESGEQKTKRIVTGYKFYNKLDALRMLGHHLGLSLDKPSEIIDHRKEDQTETFETLMRNLNVDQLEAITTMMLEAASKDEEEEQEKKIIQMDKRRK